MASPKTVQGKLGLSVVVPDAGKLAQVYEQWAALTPTALRKAQAQVRKLLIPALADYPPERAGQLYVRTGQLRRGWERSPAAAGADLRLTNASPHTRWTQSDKQAKVHRGRWTPASQIVLEHVPQILEIFEQAMAEVTSGS